jgi:hypothetical protein
MITATDALSLDISPEIAPTRKLRVSLVVEVVTVSVVANSVTSPGTAQAPRCRVKDLALNALETVSSAVSQVTSPETAPPQPNH